MTHEHQREFWPNDAEACRRRDEGIKRASDHAERVAREWNSRTDAFFYRYLVEIHGRNFLTEEFIAWFRVQPGTSMPPHNQAFGAVIRRAAFAKIIIKAGAAAANTSNRGLKTLWREREVTP
jgi:hypothetical protein